MCEPEPHIELSSALIAPKLNSYRISLCFRAPTGTCHQYQLEKYTNNKKYALKRAKYIASRTGIKFKDNTKLTGKLNRLIKIAAKRGTPVSDSLKEARKIDPKKLNKLMDF